MPVKPATTFASIWLVFVLVQGSSISSAEAFSGKTGFTQEASPPGTTGQGPSSHPKVCNRAVEACRVDRAPVWHTEGWISTAWDKFAGPEDNSAADKVNAAAETIISIASSSRLPAAVGLQITSIQLTDPAVSQAEFEVLISCQDVSGEA